jgi:hypothetical protein
VVSPPDFEPRLITPPRGPSSEQRLKACKLNRKAGMLTQVNSFDGPGSGLVLGCWLDPGRLDGSLVRSWDRAWLPRVGRPQTRSMKPSLLSAHCGPQAWLTMLCWPLNGMLLRPTT